jgi:hypothetical protein
MIRIQNACIFELGPNTGTASTPTSTTLNRKNKKKKKKKKKPRRYQAGKAQSGRIENFIKAAKAASPRPQVQLQHQ